MTKEALAVGPEEWKAEIPQVPEWSEKFGDDLPASSYVDGPPRRAAPPNLRRTLSVIAVT